MPAKDQPVAALDLGSNTFRMLIARRNDKPETTPWETLAYSHHIVRLGEGLHHRGRLSNAAIHRAMDVLLQYARKMRDYGILPHQAHAVATAAVREASNGDAFCQQVARETGIRIEVISGAREAMLSLRGAASVLDPEVADDMLLIDIGGASTEFVRARHHRCIDAISRKIGVVRLVNTYLHSDPPARIEYEAMIEEVRHHILEIESSWKPPYIPEHLVGTAGTVTTLAATELGLATYDSQAVNNHRITLGAFKNLRDHLLQLDHANRAAIHTIGAGRADLIIGGLAIIDAIFSSWRHQELVVVDAGLLEGVWLESVADVAS